MTGHKPATPKAVPNAPAAGTLAATAADGVGAGDKSDALSVRNHASSPTHLPSPLPVLNLLSRPQLHHWKQARKSGHREPDPDGVEKAEPARRANPKSFRQPPKRLRGLRIPSEIPRSGGHQSVGAIKIGTIGMSSVSAQICQHS